MSTHMSWLPDEWWADDFRRIHREFADLRLEASAGAFDYHNNKFDVARFQDWLRMPPGDPEGFDLGWISPALKAEAEVISKETGCDQLYIVSGMAFTVSVLGGRYTAVNIGRLGKRLKMILYVMNIMRSGANKTGLMEMLTLPLKEMHTRFMDEFETLKNRYEEYEEDPSGDYVKVSRTQYKEEMAELARRKSALEERPKDPTLLEQYAAYKADMDKKIYKVSEKRDQRIALLSNVTVPRILSAATYNALGLIYDDVNTFIKYFAIGTREDSSAELTPLHSGTSINVQRQGDGNSFYCPDPLVSLYLNGQPKMMKFLLENSFTGSGLTYRFIPILEPEYEHKTPEGWEDGRDYFTEESDNYEGLIQSERVVMAPKTFYAMCEKLVNDLYLNDAYTPSNRNDYTFTDKADAVRAIVRKMLNTITSAFKHPKYKWDMRTSMVSKLHEMTDKFALIFQVMKDNVEVKQVVPSENGIFDMEVVGKGKGQHVEPWAVYAGFQFARIVFDGWVSLPKTVDIVDTEMQALTKDEGKQKNSGINKDYKLLWCYLVQTMNKPGTPADQLDLPDAEGVEWPLVQLKHIVSKSNGFDGSAPGRLFNKNRNLRKIDDDGTRYAMLAHGFDGEVTSLETISKYIQEHIKTKKK